MGSLLNMKDCVRLQEKGFKAYGEGKAYSADMSHLRIEKENAVVAYKAGYVETDNALESRVTTSFPNNPSRNNMNRTMRLAVLYDDQTGFPLAIMDGTFIMVMSRGGAAAVSATYLARRNTRRVGVIGSGLLANAAVTALPSTVSIEKMTVYSRTKAHREAFAKKMTDTLGIKTDPVESVRDAIQGSDLIVTATDSREQIIPEKWIQPGTHIISVGGGMEIGPNLLARAKIVVDSAEKLEGANIINSAIKDGIIKPGAVYGHLGEIVAGKKKGRTSDSDITFWFNPGVGFQDATLAKEIYKNAKAKGVGKSFEIVDTAPSFAISASK
jgi:ornithine cyclodeaminase/alanine dehydrogenase-like protein (mu-crystallin family)